MTTAALNLNITDSRRNLSSFHGLCLIAGQVLMCVSSFFWNADGRYSIDGSVIIIMSMVFWAAGLQGVYTLFSEQNPWYARIGLLYAMYGCFGGVGFGFEGLYSMIFAVGNKIGVAAYEKFPLQMNLALYWSGPAFPLSMLILGIMLIYRKITSVTTGILFIVGAVAFPLSRISRIEWVAHVADLILLSGVVMLALNNSEKAGSSKSGERQAG